MTAPLLEQSAALTRMAQHFNVELFAEKIELSRIMFCWTRAHQVVGGFFAPNKWEGEDGEKVHELALNANLMKQMTLTEMAGVMVHELEHAYLYQEGRAGRPGYHTAEFCSDLYIFGIVPTDPKTNEPIAKGKGAHSCAQVIVDDVQTPFQRAMLSLPEEAIPPYSSDPDPEDKPKGGGDGEGKSEGGEDKDEEQEEAKPKSGSRAKYTCLLCGLNAWAKPGASLLCGCSSQPMIEAKS